MRKRRTGAQSVDVPPALSVSSEEVDNQKAGNSDFKVIRHMRGMRHDRLRIPIL